MCDGEEGWKEEGRVQVMDDRVKQLANLIYGENGGEDRDTMVMTGSSVLNREAANKPQEFGADISEVMQKGYYAVSKNSDMYQQAVSQKFPDKKSEDGYKRAYQVAYGLETGSIDKHPAQFFFKKGEAAGLRKKLKSQGKVGVYDTYSY
jgi:spore germination cell wall hydrolase CwlJ-like protein